MGWLQYLLLNIESKRRVYCTRVMRVHDAPEETREEDRFKHASSKVKVRALSMLQLRQLARLDYRGGCLFDVELGSTI